MLKQQLKFGMIAAAALVMSIFSCKKDIELPEVEENELITRVSLTFTNRANPTDVKTVIWTDLDGEGGIAATIGTLNLTANATYNFEVSEVLNETADDTAVQDIRNEIEEESVDHLFVYTTTGANLTLVRTDRDTNNFEIGLVGTATTGAASTGSLRVVLRHQPDVKNGSAEPGSTDFDTTFPVSIQ